MTETCLNFVSWLSDWFTPKTQDYKYVITSSNYKPSINSTVTITITVTDANSNLINNHTFNLDADGTYVELTTNNGVVTYSYSCSDLGVKRFSVGEFDCIIEVGGFYSYTPSTSPYYTIYYDDTTCYMEFNKSFTTNFSANSSWTDFATTQDVPSSLRPAEHTFTIVGNNGLQITVLNTGTIQWANRSSSNISSPTIRFTMSWRKQ